jgi:uncharacterized protein YjiS (DUF1127 family)
MATIAYDGIRAEPETRRGFFARALERIAEAQMSRARAIAKPHLLDMDDAELASIGYTREEISRWPNGARWM